MAAWWEVGDLIMPIGSEGGFWISLKSDEEKKMRSFMFVLCSFPSSYSISSDEHRFGR
jgi:hypothetical protein